MTAPIFFSVVIPTHNRVGLLQRALASVRAQSDRDYEVVVVNDGSMDATAEYLNSIADEKITALHHEVAGGASASRNDGVKTARGEFIVFLDDDDELRPQALAALRKHCQAFPQIDFTWGKRFIREKDRAGHVVATRQDNWANSDADICGSALLPFVLEIATNCAFTIRRSVFTAIGGFDTQFKVSEDRDLFLSLAEGGYNGGVVPELLIDVDEHFKDSLSRNVGVRVGPDTDLRVIEKHCRYLDLPQHRRFVNDYLASIFAGFLQSGNRRAAMRILGQLRRRKALDARLLRKYIRHAPEFRALKHLLGYSTVRRFRNRLQVFDQS